MQILLLALIFLELIELIGFAKIEVAQAVRDDPMPDLFLLVADVGIGALNIASSARIYQ